MKPQEFILAGVKAGYDEDGLRAFEAYEADEDNLTLDNFEEAYQGKYDCDEHFAQDLAEGIGNTPNTNEWPYHCIDWGQAAKELMLEYYEENEHYFRA